MAENGFMTVKEYADKHNISIQAVYQALKRKKNRENLRGHTHKRSGKLYLDAEAVAYLESQHATSPAVVVQVDQGERLQELQAENERLKSEIMRLQSDFIEYQKNTSTQLSELTQKVLLLSEMPQKRTFWQKLFGSGET